MEIKDRTIALLIDSDNVSAKYFSIILDELSQYGKVTYRRLYAILQTRKLTDGSKHYQIIRQSKYNKLPLRQVKTLPILK